MNKKIVIALLFLTVFFTGCGCGKKEKKITCKLNQEFAGYTVDAEYVLIYFENDKSVKKISENATFVFENDDMLNYMKNLNSLNYSGYSKIDGGKYSDNVSGKTLELNLELDFEKIKIDEFIGVNGSNQNFVVDDKVVYEKYVEKYEKEGFTCAE